MGRDLDVQVAEALGWTDVEMAFGGAYGRGALRGKKPDSAWCLVPHYSTNIAAAWRLVEQYDGEFYLDHDCGGWYALFGENLDNGCYAPTAPEAICEAFIKSV